MELKEEYYARTKNGEIGKLVNVEVYYLLGQNDKDKFSCVLFKNSCVPCLVLNDFIIKKGQLIDLIQVGDYVNGMQVTRICFDEDGQRILNLSNCILELMNEDIKSIVTKEQFESMEYRV